MAGQFFYSSDAVQTTLAASLTSSGTSVELTSITGYPTQFPFTLLLEWGTSNQEVVTVTQAATGSGPYTFANCVRGDDGTTGVSHSSGAQVNHGVSAREFFQGLAVFNVCYYGADPTGTNDSTTAIGDAITACINAGGGIVWSPAGTYKYTNLTIHSAVPVYFMGAGRWAVTYACHATSGDGLRVYDSSTYSSRTSSGGGIKGITFDGTNASAGVALVHMGDIFQYEVDFAVQNCGGTGSKGAWFDNNYYWTEQLHGNVYASNCTANIVFDNSTDTSGSATGSFERADLVIYINQGTATYDGLVFQNGAVLANGSLRYRGNFGSSASALTSAALRITGSNGGGDSLIVRSVLDIGVECDGGLAHAPYAINYGASGNVISACGGIIDFGLGGSFTAVNIGGTGFFGVMRGFTSVPQATLPIPLTLQDGLNLGAYGGQTISANGSTVDTANLAYNNLSCSASFTGLILQDGTYDGQVMTVANTGSGVLVFAASGTSFVASGTSCVLWPDTSIVFTYDYNTQLWYAPPTPGLPPAGQTASAQSITGNGQTITLSLTASIVRVTASTAARTGAILTAGTFAGQEVMVINEGSVTITMAAAGTSHVADGTGCVLATNTAAQHFVWDSSTSLWYQM